MSNIYDQHFIPSWTYQANGEKKTMDEAVNDLLDVLNNYPGKERVTIVEKRPTSSKEIGAGYYVYAEFETPTMGFVDDAEFFFQPEPLKEVEYRSASRLGESDLDANRKRIREIRRALQEKSPAWASVGY